MPTRNSQQSVISSMAPLVDGLALALAGWLAYFTRWQSWQLTLEYGAVLALATGLAFVLLPVSGAYRSAKGITHWQQLGKVIPGLVTVAALLMLAGTLTKTTADFSRLWMAYWSVYTLVFLLFFRWALHAGVNALLPGRSRATRVLIFGEGEFAQSVARKIQELHDDEWEVVDTIAPAGTHKAANGDSSDDILAYLEKRILDAGTDIDEIWLAIDNSSLAQREAILRVLQMSSLTVRYVPDLSMLSLLHHAPSEVAGMTVLNLNASPLTGLNTIIKAIIDTLFSVLVLTLLAPLLLLIALVIKLDSPGPVFFRQQRHGWDGKIIHVLKFRTMKQSQSEAESWQQAHRNDPRVTRIGGFLRRTSLDELPQFINVLRQEMSVVGPRPHPLELNKSYVSRINAYMQRHRVKPGITGWAQVHGLRGETKTLLQMQQRVEYDLYYIQHWSLWLDIRIVIATLLKGWTGSNAY